MGTLREIKIPGDLDVIMQVIVDSFQYPENPDWNLQPDTVATVEETVKNYKRMWPLVKIFGTFSYQLRDILRGYIWEENTKTVGAITLHRNGKDEWQIGNVGVLPEFRRRGIARELVEAGMSYIRQKGGKRIRLQVINGNLPAYNLYLDLGFKDYTGKIYLDYEGDTITPPELPGAYSESHLPRFDWQIPYEHVRQITPESVTRYAQVDPGDFKVPLANRLLMPKLDWAQGIKEELFVYKSRGNEQVVGRSILSLRTKPGGFNSIFARVTPGHPELANYIIGNSLSKCEQHSPGRRIEIRLPSWQTELLDAAHRFGFLERKEFREMVCFCE